MNAVVSKVMKQRALPESAREVIRQQVGQQLAIGLHPLSLAKAGLAGGSNSGAAGSMNDSGTPAARGNRTLQPGVDPRTPTSSIAQALGGKRPAGLDIPTNDIDSMSSPWFGGDRNWLLAASQSRITPSLSGNLGVGDGGNGGNMRMSPGASRALADARADINTEGSRLKKALDKSSRDPVARDLAGRALAMSMHPLLRT